MGPSEVEFPAAMSTKQEEAKVGGRWKASSHKASQQRDKYQAFHLLNLTVLLDETRDLQEKLSEQTAFGHGFIGMSLEGSRITDKVSRFGICEDSKAASLTALVRKISSNHMKHAGMVTRIYKVLSEIDGGRIFG